MPARTERFAFDNRPIGDWLLQLVDRDAARRKQAAKVITDKFLMPGDFLPTAPEMDAFFAEFSTAIQRAVNQPSFPAERFVQDLLALELALHESWCAKVTADSAREREVDAAELRKLGDNPTAAETKRYLRRAWVRILRDCREIDEQEPHEVFTTGMATIRVIEALGAELLPAAETLREMLFSKHKGYVASDAIGRMGEAGLVFYADLLEGLKRDDPNFNCSKALGMLLRAASEKIPEVLRLASEPRGNFQVGAISALATCGRAATEAFPAVENDLRALLESNPEDRIWYPIVFALGKCARTSPTVDCLLLRLDLASPGRCGEIMLALGGMGMGEERVVPRLAQLLDEFEEYDPDWCSRGEHERVVQALRGFGMRAAPAIPSLLRHVWTKPQQYWTDDQKIAERPEPDEEVIRLLGEFGSLASEALPALNQIRDEMRLRYPATDGSSEADVNPADDEEACWNIAIKRITG